MVFFESKSYIKVENGSSHIKTKYLYENGD